VAEELVEFPYGPVEVELVLPPVPVGYPVLPQVLVVFPYGPVKVELVMPPVPVGPVAKELVVELVVFP
jgi:hypothetical protein